MANGQELTQWVRYGGHGPRTLGAWWPHLPEARIGGPTEIREGLREEQAAAEMNVAQEGFQGGWTAPVHCSASQVTGWPGDMWAPSVTGQQLPAEDHPPRPRPPKGWE